MMNVIARGDGAIDPAYRGARLMYTKYPTAGVAPRVAVVVLNVKRIAQGIGHRHLPVSLVSHKKIIQKAILLP